VHSDFLLPVLGLRFVYNTAMCGSRKCPYPSQEGLLEIPRESMNQTWNFHRDEGFKPNDRLWQGYGTAQFQFLASAPPI